MLSQHDKLFYIIKMQGELCLFYFTGVLLFSSMSWILVFSSAYRSISVRKAISCGAYFVSASVAKGFYVAHYVSVLSDIVSKLWIQATCRVSFTLDVLCTVSLQCIAPQVLAQSNRSLEKQRNIGRISRIRDSHLFRNHHRFSLHLQNLINWLACRN